MGSAITSTISAKASILLLMSFPFLCNQSIVNSGRKSFDSRTPFDVLQLAYFTEPIIMPLTKCRCTKG